MSQALVYRATSPSLYWGGLPQWQGSSEEKPKPRTRAGNAWLTAEEVAHLLLTGECLDARVSVPARFAQQAVTSAVSSVQRWAREGRIFAIHDLYPRYQFDGRGRPYPAIERAVQIFGAADTLRIGNWFAAPNADLGGRRPQELLASASDEVLRALERAIANPLPA
jgi:hypothetical protein